MLFFLTCLYLLVFYFQPGGRIPALGSIRFEFVLGLSLLVLLFATRWKHIFTNERITKAGFVFFAGMTLSFIGAMQTHTATDAFEVFIELLKSFSIYLMIVATVDSEQKLRKFLWVYVACMLILVGEPFLLSLHGQNLYAREGGVIRLYGVGQFAHPNGLGINAVTALPILYAFFWHYRSYIVKAFLAAFGLICLRVIMLTASRTAYVGLLILVLLLFMYSKKKARFIAVTCFLAIVLSASVPSMYKDRFISLKEVTTTIAGNEEPNGSVGGRWDLIRDAWLVFLKYPLFGCGMDSFKRIPFDEKPYRTIGETHNLLMQVLAETGLVGLFAFVFLLSNIWRILASTKRALSTMNEGTKYLNVLVETLQIIFLMKLLIGLIGQHSLYSNIWWFLGGLTVIAARLTKEFAAEASLAASPDELIGQKTLRDQAVSVAPKRSLSPDVT